LFVLFAAARIVLLHWVEDGLTESVPECANITAFLHETVAHLFAFNSLLFVLLENVEGTAFLLQELNHLVRL
jgi:hypothetical protein